MARFICNNQSVSVSTDFIKNKMKDINGAFVKVYLYALYLANTSYECEFSKIAQTLGLLESEVIKAFKELDKADVLHFDGERVVFSNDDIKAEDCNEILQVPADVKKALVENTALSELCVIAEATYGKTLSDNDLEILYWMYDSLALPSEVILMVIEYCISIGKSNMKYVQRVAITWKENGIDTIEKADSYIKSENEKKSCFYTIRKAFGILDRPLAELEAQYLTKWHSEWGMSEDMIVLAYNYCIMQTNKLSYQYMDTIIKNWFENKIMTPSDAKAEKEGFKTSAPDAFVFEKTEPLKTDNGEYDNLAELTQKN